MKFDSVFLDDGLANSSDMTSEVLTDNEDLLHQLSAELGLGTLLEDPGHGQDGGHDDLDSMSSGLLQDEIMQDLTAFQPHEGPLFPEISCGESGYGESVKSEPCSPFSFPPSPTGSDHSDGSYRRDSPPLSPQQSVVTLLPPPLPVHSVSSINPPITILTSSAVAPAKIPIPKMRRPTAVATPAPGPIVLTLGSDGLYYPAPASLLVKTEATTTATVGLTVSTSAVAASTETFKSYCSPLVAGMPTVSTARDAEDLRNLKRQQRMIKNRESACISRKKKKEYVTSLEAEIKDLSETNMQLRMENENLKDRIRELESERKIWTETILSSNGKKATALFALIFMVSLNFNSLSGIYNSQQSGILPSPVDSPHGGGRSLLWNQADYEDVISMEGSKVGQESERPYRNSTNPKPLPMCPMFFNQTESIRLESELRGWFSADAVKPLKKRPDITTKPKQEPVVKSVQSVGHVSKSRLPSISGSLYHVVVQEPADTSRSLSLLDASPPRHTFASFFEAIDRREDTFYVVSFSGDHLLVPATNHSQANRPRMSLLLPALTMSLNDSHRAAPGSIAMMKIDCEVMNTQLVHIKQDSIPAHMAANLRTGNISAGQHKDSQDERPEADEDAASYNFGKNYRNSARMDGDSLDKDNTTLNSMLSNEIPQGKLVEQLGKHRSSTSRRKRKLPAK